MRECRQGLTPACSHRNIEKAVLRKSMVRHAWYWIKLDPGDTRYLMWRTAFQNILEIQIMPTRPQWCLLSPLPLIFPQNPWTLPCFHFTLLKGNAFLHVQVFLYLEDRLPSELLATTCDMSKLTLILFIFVSPQSPQKVFTYFLLLGIVPITSNEMSTSSLPSENTEVVQSSRSMWG